MCCNTSWPPKLKLLSGAHLLGAIVAPGQQAPPCKQVRSNTKRQCLLPWRNPMGHIVHAPCALAICASSESRPLYEPMQQMRTHTTHLQALCKSGGGACKYESTRLATSAGNCTHIFTFRELTAPQLRASGLAHRSGTCRATRKRGKQRERDIRHAQGPPKWVSPSSLRPCRAKPRRIADSRDQPSKGGDCGAERPRALWPPLPRREQRPDTSPRGAGHQWGSNG